MQDTNLLKLSYHSVSPKEFITFWSSFYNYPLEELYINRISKNQFSSNDLTKLFEWKNGSRLSAKKQKTFQKIINKLDVINDLKKEFSLNIFQDKFKFIKGIIWKIYLLHLIAPSEYPIFDQHVCRALYFITKNQKKEIPSQNRVKEKLYFDEYVTFFNKLSEGGVSRKKLDEALWAFGKFLKTSYGKKI